jgi:hypothetical protein
MNNLSLAWWIILTRILSVVVITVQPGSAWRPNQKFVPLGEYDLSTQLFANFSLNHLSPDDSGRTSFVCPGKRTGAVLYLPVEARREDTLAKGDFGQWMLKHIDRWFAFARGLGLGIEQMEELVLVTGYDRTKSWMNVAFLGNQVDARVSFRVDVDDRDASINFRHSPQHVQGAVLNKGPKGKVRWCAIAGAKGPEIAFV